MSNKKKSRFGANILNDVDRQKTSGQGSKYLSLPKGVKLLKEKVGRLKVDIIPYIVSQKKHLDYNADDKLSAHVGNPWYKKPILLHKGIGASNESVICPKTVGIDKCPICEYRKKEFAEGADKEDVLGKMQRRNLYIVRPKENKDYDDEFHVWDVSQFCFQDALNEEVGEDSENASFPDVENGLTLSIRFSEESFDKHKFAKTSRIDFKKRKKQYKISIMEQAPDLDKMVKVLSYKQLEAKFLELDDDDIDDVKKSKKSKGRVKKSVKSDSGKKEKSSKKKEKDSKQKITRNTSDKKAKGKCPEKYKFGKDWDAYDACDDCKLNEKCGDANEKLNK